MVTRVLAAGAAAILLGACGFGSPAGTVTSPAATPKPAGTATPTVRPASTPTPTATAASCRLPVASGDAPSDGNPAHGTAGHGGFVSIPGGVFTADPQSLAAYDLAAAKWLPVGRAWIAPDGKRYAYPEYRSASGPVTGIIHVVDVAGGADHPANLPEPSAPISWETAGIYVAGVIPNSDAPPHGLSLLNPDTGTLKQLTPTGAWTSIGTTVAYGTDLDSSVAAPGGRAGGPGAANRLRKIDLATGAVTTVQSYPGMNVQVLGTHGDTPVLAVVDAAGQETVTDGSATLFKGTADGSAPSAPLVVDGATIWLSGAGNIWRSVAGAQAVSIAVAGLQFALVGGACR